MKLFIDRITGKVTNTSSQSPHFLEVLVKDDFKLEKSIEIQEGEIQKTNSQGKPLYKANLVIDEQGAETYEETTDCKIAVSFQDVTEQIMITDETGNRIVKNMIAKEPETWEPLEAIMVPNLIQKRVNIMTNPEYFTLEDVIESKYKGLLKASSSNYIMADLFIDENDLDLTDANHSANTGYGILQLLPKGQAKTKLIDLDAPAVNFNLLEFEADPDVAIYINEKKFVNGSVKLNSPVNNCTIKFVNVSDRMKNASAYAIGY